VHGGDELTIVCLKYMTEALADEFISNTNESELAESLQEKSVDSGTAASEIVKAFDEEKASHLVEIRFYMEIIDIGNVEKWCAEEGFQIMEKTFGSHL